MFVLANFVSALASIVSIILTIMYWLILINIFIEDLNHELY